MKKIRKLKCIICDKIFSFNIPEVYNDKNNNFYMMLKCCSENCFTKVSSKEHKEFFKQQITEED